MMLFVMIVRTQVPIPDLELYFHFFSENVIQNINVASVHVEIM